MKSLDRDTLRSILTDPKNALIKQYRKLFEIDGIDFTIDEKALDYIVDKALEYKLGARGLRSLCEEILTDAMFELPGSDETKLRVTKSYAQEKLNVNTLKKLKAAS
jgi:ATP-dependent Clp protease ATP-binding subunit ClpX